MVKKIKTFVVDDSVIYRSQIKSALERIPEVELVGISSNGRLALDKLKFLETDLIILDVEMPEMDGISALKEIVRLGLNVKVIMFSSASKSNADITIEALNLGASDFVAKPDSSTSNISPQDKILELLGPKIQGLFPKAEPELPIENVQIKKNEKKIQLAQFRPEIVVIGSSTGGPTVLEHIISRIGPDLRCPIIIAQHMPPIFTASLAERLTRLSDILTLEARDGEILQKNRIYIAPGDYHLLLTGTSTETKIKLSRSEKINFVRPSVDPLFISAGSIFKDKCLALVLTGMGQDGRDGALIIKEKGGAVVIQDKASSVVYGMPGAVKDVGAFDKIFTPDEIVKYLNEKVSCSSKKLQNGA